MVTPSSSMSAAAKRSGRLASGAWQRNVSSMTLSQEICPLVTRSRCSGWVSRPVVALSRKLMVVSEPAPRIAKIVSVSSSSLRREPSSSRAAMRSLVMSSPGLARFSAMSWAIASRQPARMEPACSGLTVVSTIMSMTTAVLARAVSSMPIRSATSRAGSGKQNRSRRSTTWPGSVAASPSRSWLVSSTMRGRMASTRRGVNALPISLRRRMWSLP